MNEEKVLSPMAEALGITDSEAKQAFISAYCCENVEDPATVFSALLHVDADIGQTILNEILFNSNSWVATMFREDNRALNNLFVLMSQYMKKHGVNPPMYRETIAKAFE